MSDNHGEIAEARILQLLREPEHGVVGFGKKARPRGEVFDGVAADGHLPHRQEVCALGGGAMGGSENLGGIAGQVADDGVGLAKRQAESGHSH